MDSPTWEALEFPQLLNILQRYGESRYARERIRNLKPLSSVEEVTRELQRVEEMRYLQRQSGGFPGGGLMDLEPLLSRVKAQGSRLDGDELWGIALNLRVHSQVRKLLDREQSHFPLLYHLSSNLTPLPALEETIARAIHPDGSVKENASPQLQRIRKEMSALQETIRGRLNGIIAKWSRLGVLREPTFTIREGRYVLPIRSDAMGKVKGIIHDRSSTGGTLFVEPAALIDLGNDLRSWELAERDEIDRILKELTAKVRENLPQLEENYRIMGELDLLWAKALLAERWEGVSPLIREGLPLRLVGCRHPLLYLSGDREVVPLDLELGTKFTTLVISGPNAGGKTVALKTVGLLCLIALCGIPIPGKPGCEIPLFKEIIADIGDQQSILDDLSTFTARVQRMKEILHRATPQSLVLIDELGAGTDPQEGSALSIAFLEELTSQGVPTIVTTHHSALKAFAHTTPGCANGSMEFDGENFRPTYRFIPEVPGSSFGLVIAQRYGLPQRVVERSRQIMGEKASRVEELSVSLSQEIARYRLLSREAQEAKERWEKEYQQMQQHWEEVRLKEKTLRQRGEAQFQALLKEARSTIERTVKQLRESGASKAAITAAHQTLKEIATQVSEQMEIPLIEVPPPSPPPSPTEPIPDREPEVGDWVMVDDQSLGQVKALAAKKERILVTLGGVGIWLNKERVRVVQPPHHAPKPLPGFKLPQAPLELDVRGLDPPVALERLDRYLSDSYAAGRTRVGIIHGKGTGALARHIHHFLKNHPLVSRFRFGEYGEGDYGVTIAELKEE